MATKSAPLETFLTTVSPTGPAATPQQKADQDSGEGARAVILTILSKMAPIPDADLKARSELGADLYQRTLSELISKELVKTDAAGYALTPAGQEAAERERTRLLSLF